MKRNRLFVGIIAVIAAACGEVPTGTDQAAIDTPALSVIGADPLVGAIVLNQGEASEPFVGTCQLASRVTTDVTLVRTPDGGGLLRCQWKPWPTTTVFDRAFRADGFNCVLNFFGFSTTNDSHIQISRHADVANMSCRFRSLP